jgi:hypothetical protein
MRTHRVLALAVASALAICGMVAVPVAAQDEDPPATQLRLALDHLLSEHAFLIIEVMRLGVQGGPEFEAAADTLDENTTELVDAITGIYGDSAGDAFGVQWRNHIAFLVDYARALAQADTAAAGIADDQLQVYVTDFSALLAGAIPLLPESVVEGLIQEHVDQLQQVASFEASAFGEAYPAVRATYAHMFTIGDGLAVGISGQFPDKFTGRENAFSPAIDLRVTLDRLIAEHTALSSLAMRAALADAPDEPHAAAAMEDNGRQLSDAVGSIYGSAAGQAFRDLWLSHVAQYLAYVAGAKASDTAAMAAARASLGEFRADFSAFLAEANPFLSASAVEDLVGHHAEHMVTQVDAYGEGDYAGAYAIGREGFAHSEVIGAALAGAIADQFPQKFPDAAMRGRIETGVIPFLALSAVAVMAIGLLALRERRRRGI